MDEKRIIPNTKLRNLYETMRHFSTYTHLNILKDFSRGENYKHLIELFNESKNHFEYAYSNPNEKFTTNVKRKELPGKPLKINRTNDMVSIFEIKTQEGKLINVVNNQDYDFQYVNREISTIRTTKTSFASGKSGKSSGLGGLDFIGWNFNAQLPILGEIKVLDDENPFFALIQLLTYCSELSTESQIERIKATKLFGDNIFNGIPFYLYIVLSNYNSSKTETKNELLAMTLELAQLLKKNMLEIKDIVVLEFDSPDENVLYLY
jgi:hypothetical protein